jgi:hypothetical protein
MPGLAVLGKGVLVADEGPRQQPADTMGVLSTLKTATSGLARACGVRKTAQPAKKARLLP